MAVVYYIFDVLHSFLDESCTDTTGDIIKKETFRSPGPLKNSSKHENGKHIEKNVAESAMHEHISDKLCRIEVTGEEKMQSQIISQIDTVSLGDKCPEKD